MLLIYAARHYRELSAQKELRPQDVMRMLVHYHAYGDAAKVLKLVNEHASRIRRQIDAREDEETGRIKAEYEPQADKLATLDAELIQARTSETRARGTHDKAEAASSIAKIEKQRGKLGATRSVDGCAWNSRCSRNPGIRNTSALASIGRTLIRRS